MGIFPCAHLDFNEEKGVNGMTVFMVIQNGKTTKCSTFYRKISNSALRLSQRCPTQRVELTMNIILPGVCKTKKLWESVLTGIKCKQ